MANRSAATLAWLAALALAGCTASSDRSVTGALESAGTQSAGTQSAATQNAGTPSAATQAAPAAPAAPAEVVVAAAPSEPARDTAAAVAPTVDAVQDPRAYCPAATLRAGTAVLNRFAKGVKEDDPDRANKLAFRASLTDVVRECNTAGEQMVIRVGAEGRALLGPTGVAGSFTVPIRVAVTAGTGVIYSKLHDITVEIPQGRPNTTFRFVDAQVVIPKPQGRNVVVYVGFDEQRVDDPKVAAQRG